MRPGFNPETPFAFRSMSGCRVTTTPKAGPYRALERVRARPGVRSVAAIDALPLSSRLKQARPTIYIEGHRPRAADLPLAIYSVSPRILPQRLGISLRGRDFSPNQDRKNIGCAL